MGVDAERGLCDVCWAAELSPGSQRGDDGFSGGLSSLELFLDGGGLRRVGDGGDDDGDEDDEDDHDEDHFE